MYALPIPGRWQLSLITCISEWWQHAWGQRGVMLTEELQRKHMMIIRWTVPKVQFNISSFLPSNNPMNKATQDKNWSYLHIDLPPWFSYCTLYFWWCASNEFVILLQNSRCSCDISWNESSRRFTLMKYILWPLSSHSTLPESCYRYWL